MTESMATTQLKSQLKKLVCDIIDEKFDEIKQEFDAQKEIFKKDEKERRDEEVKLAREKNNEKLRLMRDDHKEEKQKLKEANQEQLRILMDAIVKNAGRPMAERKQVNDIFYGFMGCCKHIYSANGKRCMEKIDNTTLRDGLDIPGSGIRYNQRDYCLKHRPSAYNEGHVKRVKEKEMGVALREAVVQEAKPVCDELPPLYPELVSTPDDTLVTVPEGNIKHTHSWPGQFRSDCPKCIHDRDTKNTNINKTIESLFSN